MPVPDVVVIGGGIVGTASAAFLAADGARVVLVEAETIGAGASGRNSGIVQHPLDPVLASLYRDSVALYRDLEAESHDQFTLGPQPAGLLYATLDRGVAELLTAELVASHPHLSPTLLDGAALRELEPALAAGVSACRLAIGFPVEPGSATKAYAALAERRGVRVSVGATASIASRDGRVLGVTVDGRLTEAAAIVVAAGPWTPGIVDPSGSWRPIRPLWGVVAEVTLEQAPRHVLEEADIDATIEPEGRESHDPAPAGGIKRWDESGFGFSLVTAAGRSALGSTFLEDEPEAAGLVPQLVTRGARFVPELARAPIVAVRCCARPLSADGRPLVGRIPWLDGVFVAAGHGPWGISTGPASARLVADLVLGRRPAAPPALDPARFGAPA